MEGCPRPPRSFVAGVPIDGSDPVSALDPRQAEAVETYRSAAGVPGQYGGASSACGVVPVRRRR